jgi:hypothetical protein
MLAEGARQFAQGKRPSMGDLLLTPANARRVAEQLAQLRGAAMKVGQLMSMDAGDLLPPELGEILARLRSDAHPMPMSQLVSVPETPLGRRLGPAFSSAFPSPRWRRRRSARSMPRRPGTAGTWRSRCSTPACARASTAMSTTSPPCSAFPACCPKAWTSGRCFRKPNSNLHAEADYLSEGAWLQPVRRAAGRRPGVQRCRKCMAT